jgi:hypothetical protein
MRVSIKYLAGNQEVVAGTAEGGALLGRLLTLGPEPDHPEPIFLDFTGVDVATASFLREGPLAYRQILRSRGSRFYPIIANASAKTIDELRLFVESRNDAIFCCTLSGADEVSEVFLVGRLDEKQADTLEWVRKLKEADTAALVRYADSNVKATAWNNRLAALVEKGLIMESTRGRAKSFRLSVE